MTDRRVARAIALVMALTVVLSGCGTSEEAPPDGLGLTEADSPLQKYLAVLDDDGLPPSATRAERFEVYAARDRQTEELVAACMARQGFDYLPNTVLADSLRAAGGDGSLTRPDDRDWVGRWGYGIVADPWRMLPESTTPPADPNQDYIDSLTPAEQQAYEEALWGPPYDDPQGRWLWEKSGCSGWAWHEMHGDDPRQAEANQPIIGLVEEFQEKPLDGPELDELNANWSTCLARAGFGEFRNSQEARQSIHKLVRQYWRAQDDADVDQIARIDEDPEYAAIASREIALALADLECREQTDHAQRLLRIRFAAEERFIADHQEELDALVARFSQGDR